MIETVLNTRSTKGDSEWRERGKLIEVLLTFDRKKAILRGEKGKK